jgi:hypothetical protein
VRRVVPWALLLLIGIGAGLGAALGATGSPSVTGSSALTGSGAQHWLTDVLAATRAAGTAHLDYSQIVASPHASLRSSMTGGGVIDFTTESFRVSTTAHETVSTSDAGGPAEPLAQTVTVEAIAVGPSVYENADLPGVPGTWFKLPRDGGELGLGSADGIGGPLSTLIGPFTAVSITELGATHVGIDPTTRYLVQTQLEPTCPASKHAKPRPLLGRATIWVDGHGRLVQVRQSGYFSGTFPASVVKRHPQVAARPFGPFTLTSTLRLSGFGAPVHIAAPTTGPGRVIASGGTSSSSSIGCG